MLVLVLLCGHGRLHPASPLLPSAHTTSPPPPAQRTEVDVLQQLLAAGGHLADLLEAQDDLARLLAVCRALPDVTGALVLAAAAAIAAAAARRAAARRAAAAAGRALLALGRSDEARAALRLLLVVVVAQRRHRGAGRCDARQRAPRHGGGAAAARTAQGAAASSRAAQQGAAGCQLHAVYLSLGACGRCHYSVRAARVGARSIKRSCGGGERRRRRRRAHVCATFCSMAATALSPVLSITLSIRVTCRRIPASITRPMSYGPVVLDADKAVFWA